MEIPKDMVIYISKFLDDNTFCSYRLVCKKWIVWLDGLFKIRLSERIKKLKEQTKKFETRISNLYDASSNQNIYFQCCENCDEVLTYDLYKSDYQQSGVVRCDYCEYILCGKCRHLKSWYSGELDLITENEFKNLNTIWTILCYECKMG